MRDRPEGSTHIRGKNKSLVNVRLPLAVPIAAFTHSESVVVMLVPIAGLSAIVVVEPVVVITVMIAVIALIMMIAIVMILGVSQRHS